MLNSWNYYNIVNQLYLVKKFFSKLKNKFHKPSSEHVLVFFNFTFWIQYDLYHIEKLEFLLLLSQFFAHCYYPKLVFLHNQHISWVITPCPSPYGIFLIFKYPCTFKHLLKIAPFILFLFLLLLFFLIYYIHKNCILI